MELLAQVGADLPGAVRILDEGGTPGPLTGTGIKIDANAVDLKADPGTWRFSLAGVGLKFSMLKTGDRLTLPAYGQGGDWIVKLPDPYHQDVPRNEHAMMELASHAGIEVPEHALVPRNTLANLPGNAWQGQEEFAYAVRRFDRGQGRTLIHIEDFAQVKNVYPYYDGKYEGNFETVANYIYRSRDLNALREFARRLTFNILIHNSDAHLKNWSLIYKDQRIPTLSPAYDLVSTGFYGIGSESDDLGLKFGGKDRQADKAVEF